MTAIRSISGGHLFACPVFGRTDARASLCTCLPAARPSLDELVAETGAENAAWRVEHRTAQEWVDTAPVPVVRTEVDDLIDRTVRVWSMVRLLLLAGFVALVAEGARVTLADLGHPVVGIAAMGALSLANFVVVYRWLRRRVR